MNNLSIILVGLFTCLATYLFVTAPEELPDVSALEQTTERPIDVANLFNAMNTINDVSRQIYTSRIVGKGKQAGLKFGEDWAEPNIEKGPLPALFLRLVASRLETKPPPLGLYLGSDEPINKSNLFSNVQAAAFQQVKSQRDNIFLESTDAGFIAMYPDLASAKPCVTCHNEHPDSPKKDWVLNDVMGATTWTYPHSTLGASEYLEITESFYAAVREAYEMYLDKTIGFNTPISIGDNWPEQGNAVLPDADTFMGAVKSKSANDVLSHLVLDANAELNEKLFLVQK